jgi:pimeloyl-ACP methyl ester carboxylesterase
MRFRALLALALTAICIVVGIGMWRVGTTLIARGPHQVLAPPGDLPVERVTLDQPGAPQLVGWVVDRTGSCGTIVLLHGRGANRLAMMQRARMLFDAGYSVVLFDLSGHGESGGAVQGFGYSEGEDASRIIAYARQRFPGQKLGALGSSLGAASFVFATPHALADAYVLEELYATLRDTTAWRMPFHILRRFQADILLAQMPVRLGFGADDVRPVDRIGKIGQPLILLAGTIDPFIDRDQVAALQNAAPSSELVWFGGAGHVDLLRYDEQHYRDAVLPFFSKELCRARADHV